MTRRSLFLSLPLLAQEKVDKATVDRWMKELSNWGRWGKDDQLGAVNLITAAKRKQAVALVREGVSVSLARDTEKEKAEDNQRPFTQEMNNTGLNPAGGQFSVDTYSVLYHGVAHTHMDSLCHMFYEGKMYNGFPQEEVGAAVCFGALECGVAVGRVACVVRGVAAEAGCGDGGQRRGDRCDAVARGGGTAADASIAAGGDGDPDFRQL